MSRTVAVILIVLGSSSLSVAGCGGGGGGSGAIPLTGNQLVAGQVSLSTAAPTASSQLGSEFLGTVTNAPGGAKYALWGTRNADGTVGLIRESEVWVSTPAYHGRTTFDTNGRPVAFFNLSTRERILVVWTAASATFSYYDCLGRFVGFATVTQNGREFNVANASKTRTVTAAALATSLPAVPPSTSTVRLAASTSPTAGQVISALGTTGPTDPFARSLLNNLGRALINGAGYAAQGTLALEILAVAGVGTVGAAAAALTPAIAVVCAAGLVLTVLTSDTAAALAARGPEDAIASGALAVLDLVVQPAEAAYLDPTVIGQPVSSFDGSYQSTVPIGAFTHSESDTVAGLTASGSHTYTDGSASGQSTWTATITPTGDPAEVSLSGTVTISDAWGTRSTALSGGISVDESGRGKLHWLATDPRSGTSLGAVAYR